MPDSRRATLADVARAAGVSPSAVSRALNRPGRMSPGTEARVRTAAEALGYAVNPAARALRSGRTGMVAVVLSDITNPVNAAVVRGAEAVTAARDLTLVLAGSGDAPARETGAVRRLLPVVDGVVLVGPRSPDATLQALAAGDRPLVVVNREVPGLRCLVPDVAPALRGAVAHLVALGHRRIGYLGGPPESWMAGHRRAVVLAACREAGAVGVDLGGHPPVHDGGLSATGTVLASRVTAVLAFNDLAALGLLAGCRERGVAVPGDLSVMGFDDIPAAALAAPPLATVRLPLEVLGGAAVRAVAGLPDGSEAGGADGSEAGAGVPGPRARAELVLRASTAPPRR